MKVLLVQPPGGSITQPYVSTPSLTAFLRQNGIEAHQVDMGISLLAEILNPLSLTQMLPQIKSRLNKLESKLELEYSEQAEYVALSSALLTSDHALNNIESALNIMRGQGDYLNYSN